MKRGNLLWTGSRMMLSEHREMVNQQLNREQKEYEDVRREVDEQLLEEWQEIFEKAIASHMHITIMTKDKKRIRGKIINWTHEGTIFIQSEEMGREKIRLLEITDIRLK